MVGEYKNTSHCSVLSTNSERFRWFHKDILGYVTLSHRSLAANISELPGGWGRPNLSLVTTKPKLDSVREAFYADELRKCDKLEELRFEVQAHRMFGLSHILPIDSKKATHHINGWLFVF